MRTSIILCTTLLATALFEAAPAHAVDFESFNFSDANTTELDGAANTANPGNMWAIDATNLFPAEVESGVYKITKDNNFTAAAVLQTANVATGTRYIAVDMAGWAFRGFDSAELEDLRFGFLDNDDGAITGNLVTAQMQIRRDEPTQGVELFADANGVGSTNITRQAALPIDQLSPFKMVLELNKTSNTYEVFYKSGTSPSQSLGMASLAPVRNGNSVRLFVNNNFGSDGSEFISVDRIAVTDTNPLTDLVTLQIHRITGEMKLINTSGAVLSGLESYSILSPSGALNPANWKTIAGNYDVAGDKTVDVDNAWNVTVSAVGELTEAVVSGNGGALGVNQEVILSKNSGPWVQNTVEDLFMQLNFSGGVVRTANVNFIGNNGERFDVGDLNFDGALTVADWTIFITNSETDISALSAPARYQRGDLDRSGDNSIFDFGIFKDAYEAANGPGSFEAMLASVPEPGSAALLTAGVLALVGARRGATRIASRRRLPILLAALAVSSLWTPRADAGILDDFTFSDANGTLLVSAANNANPAHLWNEDADNVASSVQNGVYRITKNNVELSTNFLDNNNITTGKAWIVAEMTGWSFSSLVGPGEFDSAEPEEIRFAFLNNDGNSQGGSTITGQAIIERTATGGLQLVGKLTTAAPEIGPLALALNRSTPFNVVLEIDETTESFSVFYKDNANPYVQLGSSAPHVAGRNGNSVRFVTNNNFGGTGEFFDITRMYVTDTSPFVINTDALTLRVDTTTGNSWIVNSSATPFTIDLYRIESSANRLTTAGWNSFSEQNYGAIDGPDADAIVGNGIGETWDESGGSDANVLSESFLLGSSAFAAMSAPVPIGAPYTPGTQTPLVFQYRNKVSGAVVAGNVEFTASVADADFNNNNFVEGVDFLTWQSKFGGPGTPTTGDANGDNVVNGADFTIWKSQFGGPPPAVAAAGVVPEPGTGSLLLLALAGAMVQRFGSPRLGSQWRNSQRGK